MRKRLTEEAKSKLIKELSNILESEKMKGEDIWRYITDNSQLIELSQNKELDQANVLAFSAFLLVCNGLSTVSA